MKATCSPARSEQVKDAATQYVINRWRSALPGLVIALPCFLLPLVGFTVIHWSSRLGRIGPQIMLSVSLVVLMAELALMWWLFFRGGLRKLLRQQTEWIHRDAGVTLEQPTIPKVGWWAWPLAFILLPACVVGVMIVSFQAAVRFQPLVVAAGLTAVGSAVSLMLPTNAKRRFAPVHLLWWALYWSYAVAVAAGMPQPWRDVTERWAWCVRVLTPLILLIPIDVAACELYSRRQFRRLQELLAQETPEGGDAPD